MKLRSTTAFGIGVVATLVIGSGTAYAATGGTFVLGHSNSARTITTLSRTSGTPLSLHGATSRAPLAVNSKVKVANLNADRLDGIDSTSFALASGKVATVTGGGQYVDLDSNGTDDTIIGIAQCPAGTKLVGGGGEDDTPGGLLWASEAIQTTIDGPADAWLVASSTAPDEATSPDATDLMYVTAQCYNPRGSVPGASFRTTTTKVDVTKLPLVRARLERKLGK